MLNDLYSHEVNTPGSKSLSLSAYEGKVILIVNTASNCGFTPQYEGLQKLYMDYMDKGFVVLGFPCNQFGNQEPGSAEEITGFCSKNYHITFPIFEKIDVNGPNAHPLYRFLKNKAHGYFGFRRIPWNFTKFLISREGKVLKRFSPITSPDAIRTYLDKIIIR